MTKASLNRPFKFGPNDRREFIVSDCEVEIRAQNDSNGDPIYLGRAKPGVLESETKWQIREITWDANQGVTSVKWPQDSLGNPSTDYEFEWDERASYTFS